MWRLGLSVDARYNGGYDFTATLDALKQESYWLLDSAIRLYTADEKYELSLIGINLTDEIYAQGAGARPGACESFSATRNPPCNPPGTLANQQDQVVTTSLGVEYLLQFCVRP